MKLINVMTIVAALFLANIMHAEVVVKVNVQEFQKAAENKTVVIYKHASGNYYLTNDNGFLIITKTPAAFDLKGGKTIQATMMPDVIKGDLSMWFNN